MMDCVIYAKFLSHADLDSCKVNKRFRKLVKEQRYLANFFRPFVIIITNLCSSFSAVFYHLCFTFVTLCRYCSGLNPERNLESMYVMALKVKLVVFIKVGRNVY